MIKLGRSAAVWMSLAALLALNVHLKVRHSSSLPRYDRDDETGYFNVESAFQYRYAKMIAFGEKIPTVDVAAQYPEGVRVERELTMPMAYATGWTYRFLPWKIDFQWFVILWVSGFSSLSVLAFFLIARRLTRDPALALAAAAAYSVSWAGLSDLIGTYGFQCFALPLFFIGVACFVSALEEAKPLSMLWAWGAGAAFAAALASWHVSRFLLASVFTAAFYHWARRRKDAAAIARLRAACGPVLVFTFAAGLGLDVLRESRFIFSPTMMLGCALWGVAALRPKALGALFLALALVSLVPGHASPEAASYGHVYGLLFEKLRHWLIKPGDPNRLGWQARLLWVGPFNSPEPGFLIFTLLPLALMIAPRALGLFDEEPPEAGDSGRDVIDGLALFYAAATAMVARLMPIFIFFFCSAAALAWPRRRKSFGFGLVLALAALECFKSLAPYSRRDVFMWLSAPFVKTESQPTISFLNERAVLLWLKEHAGPGKPVAAHYGISGPVLAYTASPVLLNPKFESYSSRAKSYGYLRALYSGEEDFFAFCAKNGARYFLYNTGIVLDETPDGSRYGAGETGLRSTDAAVLFHFFPEKLKHFRLVYENPDYRVFEVAKTALALPPPRDPIYDIERYHPQNRPGGVLYLDIPGVLARLRTRREQLLLARLMRQLGQRESALAAYEKSFAAWPPDNDVKKEAGLLRALVDK